MIMKTSNEMTCRDMMGFEMITRGYTIIIKLISRLAKDLFRLDALKIYIFFKFMTMSLAYILVKKKGG